MDKKNMDRNLKYNRNEKRISDTYSKQNLSEDTTKYGEFISSFDKWIPIEQQKKRAAKMQKITKNKKQK